MIPVSGKYTAWLLGATVLGLLAIAGSWPIAADDYEGPESTSAPQATLSAEKKAELARLAPAISAVTSWKALEPRYFAPQDLYEYIDGGADFFLAYGFEALLATKYAAPGSRSYLTADIYDMESDLNAFGIYSAERPPDLEYLPLGSQGYRDPNLVVFWKSRYLVKVSASVEGAEPKQALLSLAKRISDLIPGNPGQPGLLGLLPAEGRVANTEKYVRQDFLGHGFLANAVSATYRVPGQAKTASLFVIEAENGSRAASQIRTLRAFEQKNGRSLTDLKMEGLPGFKVKDSYFGSLVVLRKGRRLIGLNSPLSASTTAPLLRQLLRHVESPAA